MIRKELLDKVSSIEPTTVVVYTYDIGVGFILITKGGLYEELGYNFSEWPLHRFPALSKCDRERICRAINSESFDLDDLKGTKLDGLACLIEDYNQNVEPHDRIKTADLVDSLQSVLQKAEGSIYAYCVLESWHNEIALFASAKEIEEDFIGRYELTPWERLDDEDLMRHLTDIKAHGFSYIEHDRKVT